MRKERNKFDLDEKTPLESVQNRDFKGKEKRKRAGGGQVSGGGNALDGGMPEVCGFTRRKEVRVNTTSNVLCIDQLK